MGSKKDSKKQEVEILIVEDSPTQAMKLQHFLERKNFRVSVAQNGREALTVLKKFRPALVISDVVMPEMDGFELCQKIKTDENLKAIPMILLTALTDPDDIIKGLTSGANNFVTKPYDEKVLLSSIDYVLANRVLRQKVTSDMGIEIFFSGQRHFITSDRMQILDLLISTYEVNVQKSRELERANKELKKTQGELRALNEQLEQKVLERTERISHLNKMILAVRNVNQLITMEKDRDRLLQRVCEKLIEARGDYKMWIVLLNESGGFVKAFEAGLGKDFLPMIELLKRNELPDCCRKALKRPGIVVTEDPASSCADCPMQDIKDRSGMSIRLEHDGKVYGLLSGSFPRECIKDEEEQALFEEVAGDIGFALHGLELEEKRYRAEEALRKRTNDLGERVKELDCLYGLSKLVEQPDISLEEIFQGIVQLILLGWQYPDITCSRVVFEDKEFKTDNFKNTKWKQSADIKVSGKKAGIIEVCYLEERPELDEGPFSKEERNLLDALAERLGEFIERKQVEEELKKHREHLEELVGERTAELAVAKERAESADRLKSAFLATMSHELRTPLNSIIGFTGIVLQGMSGPLNDEQTKQIEMVRTSSRHLLSLINDVLDISKIEAGQLEIVSEPFDMREAIEKVVHTVTPLAEKKGLALVAEMAPQVGRIVSDRRRVEQIIINLLNNAVKFTEKGKVLVECRVDGGRLVTRVVDTGIGIKPEDMDKLFNVFQQIDTRLTRQHEGTGLGLSICKKLVEMLGGEIRAESKWGVGSTFTFTLPIQQERGD